MNSAAGRERHLDPGPNQEKVMHKHKGMIRNAIAGCLGLLVAGCVAEPDMLGSDELVVDQAVAELGTPTVSSAPSVVAAFGKEKLDVFFRGTQGQLVQRRWTVVDGWDSDVALSGPNYMLGAPSCVTRLPEVMDCFVRRYDGQIYGINFTSSGWGIWKPLDTPTLSITDRSPAATVTGNNQVDIFFIDGYYLKHMRWAPSTSWSARSSMYVGPTQGSPSCGSRGDNTWSCAIFVGNRVRYYSGDVNDNYTAQEFDTSTSTEPSVVLRGNSVYLELFHRIAPSLNVSHTYFHPNDPMTSEIRTDMSSLVDMPRCAPWGNNEMLCVSRDAWSYLIYSFYTYPPGTSPTGLWTYWLRQ
jgi:hypothetical protein